MPLATESDAVREYTLNVGREHPEREWILSDYDSWARNPFYRGPKGRHPEDDRDEEWEAYEAEMEKAFGPRVRAAQELEFPF